MYKMGNKYFTNRGVERNKKRLRNIVYSIEIVNPERVNIQRDEFLFKDVGYLSLTWGYEGTPIVNWHGLISPDELRDNIGQVQWAKFCQGKRTFVIQRRINGRNIPKK
jgi:hypothetical protein